VLHFQVKKPLTGVQWKVRYIVDSTGTRTIINLLETADPYDFQDITTTNKIELATPKIDVEQVPRRRLLNVGLLQIEAVDLKNEGERLMSINMVVHVSKDKNDDNILLKTVLNPLE
jgi:hypothetical protein